jgi:hypothetical protein
VYPGFTWDEFPTHLFNIWWLAYVFWGIGAFTQLSIRPKDSRWRLFIAMNYLMALFIMFGAISSHRILLSAILLRVVAWFLLPIYLHFHWVFPSPLKPLPRWLLALIYAVCSVVAVGELFQRTPRTSYLLAVAMAFGGSILLLICHYIFQREHRRDMRFLAAAAFLSMFLAILIGISGEADMFRKADRMPCLPCRFCPAHTFMCCTSASWAGWNFVRIAPSLFIFSFSC